ncbi:MAG: sulfite reductase subunit alpha [Verrucomicrobiales bacterium]|nr:sulfite reductase subunit alpha [Verrucomicrobiales bacterium]
MNETHLIPCLPESAPFTAEQRAYLNGFLAGIFSRAPAANISAPEKASTVLSPLTILFGSQTGTAENLAKRVGKEAGKRGFAATVHDLGDYSKAQLPTESRLLIITSTYGDGEPPDNAKAFWQWLVSDKAAQLQRTSYSVCALGDTNYAKFCAFGQDLDTRLESLGAKRVFPRADCDLDLEEPFARWMNAALDALGQAANPVPAVSVVAEIADEPPKAAGYSRSNPFVAELIKNRKLNEDGSEKNTRHFEISLAGSGLTYEPGDALGVMPANCPELVDNLLSALNQTGDERVPGPSGFEISLREALVKHYEITRIPRPLLAAMADRTGDELLKKLVSPTANGELTRFLWGREIVDLLNAYPSVRFSPANFLSLLKKLQPRLYSISSSLKVHPEQVHLTVGIVQYESLGRKRKGVCSTFLADRTASVPVFVHTNKAFRPPPNGDTPMIMVGPGTGIAPFRSFLHDRRASGAKGKNWLFFGEQRSGCDFLYRDELEQMRQEGSLARLDTAFSRDQTDKVYVQHRLREHGGEVFKWLEEGAHFYVCGDASRMAKDVDSALREIVQTSRGCSGEEADDYLTRLKAEKRYQRDVY